VPGQQPLDQGVAQGGQSQQPQPITYRVNVPYGYKWDGAPFRMCDPNRMRQIEYQNYQPPFIDRQYFTIIEQGMREAATIIGGTARTAQTDLDFVAVAGKTGTAEYCDEVARPKGLCIPGQWPSHAWYFGYAPYDDRPIGQRAEPEIAIIAFVYNGKEGSGNALPVVKRVMYCYLTFADQRRLPTFNGQVDKCDWERIRADGTVTN
jgi:membrane carboxypeptidase/penicillin-binding protein